MGGLRTAVPQEDRAEGGSPMEDDGEDDGKDEVSHFQGEDMTFLRKAMRSLRTDRR